MRGPRTLAVFGVQVDICDDAEEPGDKAGVAPEVSQGVVDAQERVGGNVIRGVVTATQAEGIVVDPLLVSKDELIICNPISFPAAVDNPAIFHFVAGPVLHTPCVSNCWTYHCVLLSVRLGHGLPLLGGETIGGRAFLDGLGVNPHVVPAVDAAEGHSVPFLIQHYHRKALLSAYFLKGIEPHNSNFLQTSSLRSFNLGRP